MTSWELHNKYLFVKQQETKARDYQKRFIVILTNLPHTTIPTDNKI